MIGTGVIEWVWTFTSAIGAAMALYGTIDALIDYADLDKNDSEGRDLGGTLVVTETLRFLIQGGHLTLGILLLLNPQNTISLTPAVGILIGTGILLMVSTLLTIRVRLRIGRRRRNR